MSFSVYLYMLNVSKVKYINYLLLALFQVANIGAFITSELCSIKVC